MRTASLVVALGLAGCEPTAPATISWQQDVMPIVAANCVRCHGDPRIAAAAGGFRLDSFDDTVYARQRVKDDRSGSLPHFEDLKLQGAASYAPLIPGRIESDDAPMPPRFPLEPWDFETLDRWSLQEPVTRGEPRPDNHLPVLDVRELGRDGTTVTLVYDLHDPDGDLVVGQLCDDDGASCTFVAPLQSGHAVLHIDTSLSRPPIMLRAKLDDGAGMIEQAALTMEGP